MDYDEIKRKIMYSKKMKMLGTRISPIKEFLDARMVADRVQASSEYIAVENSLNRYYCGTLALAKYLGTVPYGKEGKLAIDEILTDGFSQANASIEILDEILNGECPRKLKDDLRSLEEPNSEMSLEAQCVLIAEEIQENFNILTKEEKEKLGISFENVMEKDVKKDNNGNLVRGPYLIKLKDTVKDRRESVDLERKNLAKSFFTKKIVDAILDEQ